MLENQLPKIVTKSLPGPKAKEIIDRRHRAVPDAIGCSYPCVIKRGAGAVFEDVDGNIFLDWVGGVGVLNIGYSKPEVVEAVKNQADRYFHAMMNIVTHEGYVSLAEKMNEITPVKGKKRRTMFANSGAEADENAVKIAKAYTKRPNIIVFTGAFHGRTLLTMSMTSKKAYAAGMGPFPDGIYRAKYPDLYHKPDGMTDEEAVAYYVRDIERVFEECSPAEYIAAIVVEPVQGEGGFIPAPIAWVKAVRDLCDKHGILLVVDEVQCGFCRSGRMFVSNYWEDAGCAPDILATAKSIAGGIPLAAVVAGEEIYASVPNGVIGGTFGGNALACAAALKVIECMEKENYAQKSLDLSEKLKKHFNAWKEKYPVVGDVRGVGCMLGIEFVTDQKTKKPATELVRKIVERCAGKGLIMESAGTCKNVIRMLAPLCMTEEQMEAGCSIYEDAIQSLI